MKHRIIWLSATILLVGFSAPAPGQDLPPYIRTVIFDVKPDRINDFVAAQKELNAALKQAGMPGRTTWQVVYGPSTQFRMTSPVQNLVELDDESWLARAMPDAGERAAWLDRIRACQASREVVVSRVFPDLSVVGGDDESEGDPPYLLLYLGVNLNGKMGSYRDFLRDQIAPAYEEAGVRMMVLRRALGGNQREWIVARPFQTFEEIDGMIAVWHPLSEVMTEDELREKAVGSGSLLASQHRIVMQRRDDLSFTNE